MYMLQVHLLHMSYSIILQFCY